LRRGLAVSERLGDERSSALVLNSLGGVLQRLGKFEEAADALRQSAAIEERFGNQRGLAIALNSLGGILQRLDQTEEADRCFESSIALGTALRDSLHLAKVHTAFGKALLTRRAVRPAIVQLRQGFALDAGARNVRGLRIVTPLLVSALRREDERAEAEDIIKRALAIAPDDSALLRLTGVEPDWMVQAAVVVRGRVKRLLEPMGRVPYGFITVDTGGDVYFSQGRIGTSLYSRLSVGSPVEADVVETARGREAYSVRLSRDSL
jgi:tetratricopeptide (TPR) repeat protein